MQNNTVVFESGCAYHVYNRAVGNEKLFFEKRNYEYFLLKLYEKTKNHINIIAYCLLKNHYHLLVEIKEKASPKLVSEAFRSFGISYSQAINKQESRKGSLFMRPIKRKKIINENYFKNLIVYIHTNPVLHGFVSDFESYQWSSYSFFIRDGITITKNLFKTKEIIKQYFNDVENLMFVHKQKHEYKNISDLIIED